jgi:hypothetical protein
MNIILKMEKEPLNEYINSLKLQLEEMALVNSKLAYGIKLFSSCYYTIEEKIEIASSLDNCQNQEQIENLYRNHTGELKQLQKGEYMMTPNFKRSLINLYKDAYGFNPLEEFSGMYEPISTYIRLISQIDSEEPGFKKEAMEKHILELKEKIKESNSTILHLLSNV